MPTHHIEAAAHSFAKTVLMPGDPLRAKFIAETFLDKPQQISRVRNMLAFTGSYKNHPISVMGGGMGIPSISIYARELFVDYDVNNIIRVGSCGALASHITLGDIIIANGAGTDSGVNRTRFAGRDFPAVPHFPLLRRLVETAERDKIPVNIGPVFSADLFYGPPDGSTTIMAKLGILAVEMEAAGLFGCAAECGKNAAAICAVSDHITAGGSLSSSERETGFLTLAKLTLEAAMGLT